MPFGKECIHPIRNRTLNPQVIHLTISTNQKPLQVSMAASQNRAAWLREAGKPLEVGDAPMPSAGPGEIVVKNAAVAINPLDCHQQDVGVFVQQWPAIIGCDVAGEVYEVGPGVDRFKQGDRVIG